MDSLLAAGRAVEDIIEACIAMDLRHLPSLLANYSYGGMEVARTFAGVVTATKWLGDMFELAKALRNMLRRLHRLVNGDMSIARRVQVVGVCTVGLALQFIRLRQPGIGRVCWLAREELVQVPKDVRELPELFKVFMMVAQLKEVISILGRIFTSSRLEPTT
ncbi:hypothetical protein HOY82DRAFT_624385 [Tuber indicum]|nr:hypothetical protein HOY82DRAFT_624385 [Tuber indicum]